MLLVKPHGLKQLLEISPLIHNSQCVLKFNKKLFFMAEQIIPSSINVTYENCCAIKKLF